MAINERLVHTASAAAAGGGTGNQEEGLILHLDANDVDSYDGDGTEWVDIANYEYTPSTDVSEHFNTVTYIGNSGVQDNITCGFRPDFVWFKVRDAVDHHALLDSVRGDDSVLYSNLANGEGDWGSFNTVDFEDDGFSLKRNKSEVNTLNKDYVAWCFKAGGAPSGSDKVSIDGTSYATMSAAGLTDGTEPIDKLSVNTKLGFSIVKYTAPALTADTVAHGLGESPEMIILKSTSAYRNWNVYHKGVGLSKNLHLNTNDAANTDEYWTANSNTFSIQDYSASADWIAYSFTSKRGVSKVGSYTGNGTTDNKIVTGFEPAFVMIKNTSINNTRWIIMDNARDPDNPAYKVLSPNYNGGEDTSTSYWLLDWERDGFRLKYGADSEFNKNGDKFIYYAVAKNTNETSLTTTKDNFEVSSISDDLKLHIDIGNSSCYSGTGTTVNDLSSSSHTITTLGGVQSSDFNSSLRYLEVDENANEGLTISDHSDFDHTNGATYEGWVYLDPNGTSEETFFFRGPSNAQGLRVYWHASYGWFPRDFNASGSEIIDQWNIRTGASGFGRGKWYHLALTLSSASSATYTFYVDGNLIGTSTASGNGQNSLSYGISLGKYGAGGTPDLNGKIGQFRFYGTVLSSSEIKSNYETTKIYSTPELKVHLDAASFPEYGEAGYSNTPSTWTDSSSNSNNGTITGATFDSELGNWLDFDGSNDFVDLGDMSGTNAELTVSAWVNPDSTQLQYATIYDFEHSNDEGWVMYQDSNTTNSYKIALKDGSIWDISDTFSLTANTWNHIVFTVNTTGGAFKLYVNGFNTQSKSGWGGLGSQQKRLNLGCWGGNDGVTRARFWNGQIGQFRLYDKVLTQAQIIQNYNFTKPSYPNGNDAIISNVTWSGAGYFDFNGSTSKVDLQQSFFNNVSQASYSVWVYFDNLNTQNFIIFPNSGTTGHGFGFFDFGNGNIYFQSDNTTNSNRGSISNSGLYTTGEWVHFAQVYDGTATGNANRLKAYVNGNLLSLTFSGTIPSTTQATTYNTLVGTRVQGNFSLDGQISKVKAYDKPLTQAEVTALYNEGE